MISAKRVRFGLSLAQALFSLGLLLVAPEASAFERQWRVGAGAGIATLRGSTAGPAVGAHGAYGLSDMFDLNVELLASRHFGGEDTDVLSASAGASYKIDVFEWVPYVVLLGGYYHYLGEPGPNGESGSEAGASVGGGLDYLPSRHFALGVQARSHLSFREGLGFPIFSAVLRGEYRWGW